MPPQMCAECHEKGDCGVWDSSEAMLSIEFGYVQEPLKVWKFS